MDKLRPVNCSNPTCKAPLSPNVVETNCSHLFHEKCYTNWDSNQSKDCPSCTQKLKSLSIPLMSDVDSFADCPICSLKLKPVVVIFNCGDGAHLECHNASSKEQGAKCPSGHSINYDSRKIYTNQEYSSLVPPAKSKFPLKLAPPPTKSLTQENTPAQEQKTTWKQFGWKMTKMALATAVVYKAGRWFF